MLGDATFYWSILLTALLLFNLLSWITVQIPIRCSFLKSNVTNLLRLKLTGAYGYTKGMSAARGADNEPPSLAGEFGTGPAFAGGNNNNFNANPGLDRGAFMPENNIPCLQVPAVITDQFTGFILL
jgi:hypothetical protein